MLLKNVVVEPILSQISKYLLALRAFATCKEILAMLAVGQFVVLLAHRVKLPFVTGIYDKSIIEPLEDLVSSICLGLKVSMVIKLFLFGVAKVFLIISFFY
jgi:hypothetical protein